MISNKKLIDLFIEKLVLENYSENTIVNYRIDIEFLIEFLNEMELDNLTKITNVTTQNFNTHLARSGFIGSSRNRKLSSIRHFYNFLLEEEYVKENYFNSIKSSKKAKKLPKFIVSKEIKILLDSIDTTSVKGIRDKTIIEILYGLGIRVSELTSIKLKDISFYDETILIHGKGSKERIVPMHSGVVDCLREYLYRRNELLVISKNEENEYLFINLKGTTLTSRGVRMIVNSAVETASLNTKITPHMFRHSFATDLLNNGADIRSVQELLGHVNLSSTQIYTDVSIEKLKSSYLDAFPRKKGGK